MTEPPRVAQFWIPGRLPGQNEWVALLNGKGGRHVYNKAKERHMNAIAQLARAARIPAFKSCHARFEWVEPNRKRDPDNFCCPKPIFDALQLELCGPVLANDGWSQVLSITHKWRVDAKAPGVLVTLIAG